MRKGPRQDNIDDNANCQEGMIIGKQCGCPFYRTSFEESGTLPRAQRNAIRANLS